ncbi:hypothetical protein [Rhodococcus rhodochrous]|uniref:Uncharacterized protein n=2 Tax=Rhodococcus rhodochrous TaxID=1829 RepID=A0AA46WYY0_RHORH|nr:hypothetical protein [Rhodococcus rhodochrous]UZF46540.1 hypothetical protein KUM34_007680 [Rhodococcus rhodochrous]
MSRTAWAVTAVAVAMTAGTVGFVSANRGESAPSEPSSFTVARVADETTTGGPDGTVRAGVDPARDAGPGDLPTDIPYIDVTTCDSWFEDWDDTVPDHVEDFYDEWDDRCDDLHDDDHDDWDDDHDDDWDDDHHD